MITALELFLIAYGLTYYLATTGAGVMIMRKFGWGGRHRRFANSHRTSRLRRLLVTSQEPPPEAVVVPPDALVTYFLVACLNEELVIGRTIRALLGDPRARVVVVDDGSDDDTGAVAAAVDPVRVTVVRRELPEARLGKGPALNFGLAAILHDAGVRQIAASRIIICVMDADGELSPHALDQVLPLFGDGRVGGVQLPVKIRNTNSLLTTLQDLEFWGIAAVSQVGRNATGTVSLGGNGQFTRLTALLGLGREPWRARLTEDLDLGLALSVAGWRLLSTPRAHVTQQAVPVLRALVRQRTRWNQGHLEASEWLGKVWSSRKVSHLGMLEMTLYLLVPWMILPWSLCMNYNIVMTVGWWMGWAAGPPLGSSLVDQVIGVVTWYLSSFFPLWVAGILYSKQRPGRALLTLLSGHLLLFGNYIAYVSVWRALFRYLRGSRSWAKTKRVDERSRALRSTGPIVVVSTVVSPVPVPVPVAVPVAVPMAVSGPMPMFTPVPVPVPVPMPVPVRESWFTSAAAER
jgi:cellulose synthase/poly-beta-1,6-N-acetylglucosamine synthase-like glycosyltransferase